MKFGILKDIKSGESRVIATLTVKRQARLAHSWVCGL